MNSSKSEDKDTVLFKNLLDQFNQSALIFMGKIPNPNSGKKEIDLNLAKYFIDQLVMIRVKTRGNLDVDEEQLLESILKSLNFNFNQFHDETTAGS